MKERLKQLRKEELKISRKKIAKKLNITEATYGRYETGELNPPNRAIADICREFDVNEEWLREGKTPIFREMTEHEKAIKVLLNNLTNKEENFIYSLYLISLLEKEEIKIIEKIASDILKLKEIRGKQ